MPSGAERPGRWRARRGAGSGPRPVRDVSRAASPKGRRLKALWGIPMIGGAQGAIPGTVPHRQRRLDPGAGGARRRIVGQSWGNLLPHAPLRASRSPRKPALSRQKTRAPGALADVEHGRAAEARLALPTSAIVTPESRPARAARASAQTRPGRRAARSCRRRRGDAAVNRLHHLEDGDLRGCAPEASSRPSRRAGSAGSPPGEGRRRAAPGSAGGSPGPRPPRGSAPAHWTRAPRARRAPGRPSGSSP